MNKNDKFKSTQQVQHHYGIRKFKVGIVSVMFASFFYINTGHTAHAAELSAANDTMTTDVISNEQALEGQARVHQNVSTQPQINFINTVKPTDPKNGNVLSNATTIAKSDTLDKSQEKKDEHVQEILITENQKTTDQAIETHNRHTDSTAFRKVDVTESEKNQVAIPAPQAETKEKTVQGINEKVYEKAIPVMKHPKTAQTIGMSRGIGQGRESLGMIVPANTKLYIRQARTQNTEDLRVSLMTDDGHQNKNKVIPKNGAWVNLETTIDSAAFVNLPRGIDYMPLVDFYIENNLGRALPTYRKGENQVAFEAQWKSQNSSYAYVEGKYIAFLIPKVDQQRISDMKQSQGHMFKSLDDMIDYYDDVITKYNQWTGLNEDPQSIDYNVGMKYFTVADKHGFGVAYWSWDRMGSNSDSLHGYLQPGWLGLHEVGHGFDGWMVRDNRMELLEVWNNILANEYQTKVQGIKNGWLYGDKQQAFQKRIHEQMLKSPESFSYASMGLRDRLDFMMRIVRLTSIDGLTKMLQSMRVEASKAPMIKDVPRWINTYWLADSGYNGLAYFDLYHIDIPTKLKEALHAYPNSYIYPLALLIHNDAERQKYVKKLGLATEYELVRTSDIKDTAIKTNATVNVNMQNQILPEDSVIQLLDGTEKVAEATIVNGKAQFEKIHPGIYKIIAPLSKDLALPEDMYLVVSEKGSNHATVSYPAVQTRQAAMTERVVLQGLSNREFVTIEYQPQHHKVIYRQNQMQPHYHFKDEYARITIKNKKGAILFDNSLVGNVTPEAKEIAFEMQDGDTITVKHREPNSRRQVQRIENGKRLIFPNQQDETVTYTLTEKGLIVNNEGTEASEKRYVAQIQEDVTQLISEMKAYPDRNYRTALFRIVQGVQHMDVLEKEKQMQRLQPYLKEVVLNRTPIPIVEATERDSGYISGNAAENAWVSVAFPSGAVTKIQADAYGYWEAEIPADEQLKVDDTLAIVARTLGKFSSPPIYAKVTDTIAHHRLN